MGTDGESDTATEPAAMGPRRLVIREADVTATLRRLADLRDRTDPRRDARGEADKDFHARRALLLAGGSLWPIIEWAVHHEAGRCARGIEAALVPPAGRGADPEYHAAAARANAHPNELEGREFATTAGDRDPAVTRASVAWVLRTLLRDWPPAQDVANELEGLNRGERPRILVAPRNLRDRDKALWRLRRLAVQHVHFRAAGGVTIDAARAHVAAAFTGAGHALEVTTLRQWEARLPKMNGAIAAYDTRQRAAATRARLADEYPEEFAQAWGPGALADAPHIDPDPPANADAGCWRRAEGAAAVRMFGEDALKRLAADYAATARRVKSDAAAPRKTTKRRAA
jgi:hypothetical protein